MYHGVVQGGKRMDEDCELVHGHGHTLLEQQLHAAHLQHARLLIGCYLSSDRRLTMTCSPFMQAVST